MLLNHFLSIDCTISYIINVLFSGAFGFEEKKPPTEGNILTTTRSHSNKTVVESIEACEPTEVIRVGGAGHKVGSCHYC